MNLQPISENDLQLFRLELPEWELKEGKLVREFVFANFRRAFIFLTELALLSEDKNHHPEIYNAYKTVRLSLQTHEVNGLTQKDLQLARCIEKITHQYST